MNRYRRLLESLSETPFAMRIGALRDAVDVLVRGARGEEIDTAETRALFGREVKAEETYGAVAVLPIFGAISQRLDFWGEIFGGASTIGIGARLRKLVADEKITTIVLNIDSPGGSVFGIEELAKEILEARKSKRIIAVANSQIASAAYWIASAATEIVIVPGGEVGAIGVFTTHQDVSAALEEAGVKMTIVAAGKYKAEGNPFEPLTDEARDAMQARVDEYYRSFVAAVAKNRGVSASDVRQGFGEGRMVGARGAVALGMADRIASLDDTIARALGGAKGKRHLGMAAEDTMLVASPLDSEAIAAELDHGTPTAEELEAIAVASSSDRIVLENLEAELEEQADTDLILVNTFLTKPGAIA